MKRGVVNPKPVIKKALVLYLINYPATISFSLHRRSNVSGRCLLLSDQCESPPGREHRPIRATNNSNSLVS